MEFTTTLSFLEYKNNNTFYEEDATVTIMADGPDYDTPFAVFYKEEDVTDKISDATENLIYEAIGEQISLLMEDRLHMAGEYQMENLRGN